MPRHQAKPSFANRIQEFFGIRKQKPQLSMPTINDDFSDFFDQGLTGAEELATYMQAGLQSVKANTIPKVREALEDIGLVKKQSFWQRHKDKFKTAGIVVGVVIASPLIITAGILAGLGYLVYLPINAIAKKVASYKEEKRQAAKIKAREQRARQPYTGPKPAANVAKFTTTPAVTPGFEHTKAKQAKPMRASNTFFTSGVKPKS